MKKPAQIDFASTEHIVLDTFCELGEGVLWDELRHRLLWTDILKKKLCYKSWESPDWVSIEVSERLCSMALVEGQDEMLLCAFESGLAFMDLATQKIEWIEKIDQEKGVRLNDGRVDRQGRFWVGSMGEGERTSEKLGKLYCLDRGHLKVHMDGIGIANGLSWSADGRRMYFADSFIHMIECFEFDPKLGALGDAKSLVKTDDQVFPDGSCVDREGFLWNAQWGSARVVRYDHEGIENYSVKFPTSQVSCPCFVGPDLSFLAVTSAREGMKQAQLDQEPHAGNLFLVKTPFQGSISDRYKV
ncbi:MAG: SMP-30/gluconolactonase/LRE family protein [Bdellovibrionales bacterium]|nr:SMP-30/gluconolactonase/LRE family protein [Bdellovibrionales bacterium]